MNLSKFGSSRFVDFPSASSLSRVFGTREIDQTFPECQHSGKRQKLSRVSTLGKLKLGTTTKNFPECPHSGKRDTWQFPADPSEDFPSVFSALHSGKRPRVNFPWFDGQTAGPFPSVFGPYCRVLTLGNSSRYGWRSRSAGFFPECRHFPSVYEYTR